MDQGRAGNVDLLHALVGVEVDGLGSEDREGQASLGTEDLDAVVASALVGAEAPGTTGGESALKFHHGIDRVLHGIETAAVGLVAVGFGDDTEVVLEEVNLMGGKVVEVATTGDAGLETPGQRAGLGVLGLGGSDEAYLHGHDLAQHAAVDEGLHFLEIGEVAAVVGHIAAHARLLGDMVDADAVLIACGEGLLDVARFA